jgi:hypothetical protein
MPTKGKQSIIGAFEKELEYQEYHQNKSKLEKH